ncbi:uncharacterized protein LOC128919420 isoform X2 [Rissa tridactyla]|uniref:uncharacterized protein LOC128919420 isoform X2 n=1 Tax=Rissa tridactyla TaxID=75485 RepID=UPI0023BB1019|nr:uncharacterized protein LOC128919420 isoform X2 [Rissa tridactyla]
MFRGAQLFCCLLLPLLQRGCGDTEYGDLEDEGLYLYLDEDGPPEVLGGPARCQDTYQDWISLYCWAPFHATLMATPEGSRCRWDQISRWVGVTLAVPNARSEWGCCCGCVTVPVGRPDATSPQHLQRALRLHPAAGPAALLPLARRRPRRLLPAGPRRILHQLHGHRAPWAGQAAPRHGRGCGCGAQLPRAPRSCPHAQQNPERGSNTIGQLPSPCLPPRRRGARNSPRPSQPWELMSGTRVRGQGRAGTGFWVSLGMEWVLWHGGRLGPGLWTPASALGRGASGEGSRVGGPDPTGAKPLLRHPEVGAGRECQGCQAGEGEPQALAGSHCPIPAHPIPSLRTPGGCAEITGCLPGRGSRRPAGGSNKEQDQGAPTLWPLECRGLMASRCGHWPVKGPAVCPGVVAARPRERRVALPGC